MAQSSPPVDREAWSARFGWFLGGLAGVVLGLIATWLLETRVLVGHVTDAAATATRASSVLVGGAFLAGALAGHALGSRAGAARYRLLASAAGVTLAVTSWALLVLTR